MKVLKFGGTSVGTTESLRHVLKVAQGLEEEAVIVVSALGGLTDRLIATAEKASSGGEWRNDMQQIRERHFNIISDVVLKQNLIEVSRKVGELLDQLAKNYEGLELLGTLSEESLATIVSFGERMSAPIVAGMIPGAALHDSTRFIKTEKWFGRDIADTSLTNELIKKEFEGFTGIHVTGGFISSDRDTGKITNLGRGGSDYTAALIAATLDASSLEIWTDVDGFMTSDPRKVSDARVIDEMSFVESMELCSFGAKVIYPPTIYPVFHKNIPIKILNTFNLSAPGTLIIDQAKRGESPVRGLSVLHNISLMKIQGKMTRNVAVINSRTYNSMARHGLNMYLLSQPDSGDVFSFAIGGADTERALNALNDEFAPELISGELESIAPVKGLATIAAVGDELGKTPGIGSRIINTLERNGIKVIAGSEGSSKTTVTIVVEEADSDNALRIVHSTLFPVK